MSAESVFFGIVFAAYFGATVAYVISLIFKKEWIGKTGTLLAVTGLVCHTAALGIRMVAAKRFIGYNFYEYMSIFAWCTVLIYLIVELRRKVRIIGVFVLPIGFLLIGYASILPKDIQPLVPAFRGIWLLIHIVTTAISYSAFALSFGGGIMYLIKGRITFAPGISAEALDTVNSRAVALGFFFLTIGILTGAIWAQHVWNRAWGWDPKETASLVTWLVYAAYLHTRFSRGWRGKRAAILSIAG